MDIQPKDDGKSGAFYAYENGKQIGEMTYELTDNNTITIYHTEVDTTERNKGIATKLVEKGVEYARANKLKIIPLCPFAKIVLKRNLSYADVLVK